jgi:hypothetical protein
MTAQLKTADGASESDVISVRDGVRFLGILVVAFLIVFKILLSFERVDLPRVEVDDPSAPLVLNESTRMQTNDRHNPFFNQVDSSFALKMCDSSINDLNAKKAELETRMRNLPEGDLEELEYEFQIGFVNVELRKRYDALLSQYD